MDRHDHAKHLCQDLEYIVNKQCIVTYSKFWPNWFFFFICFSSKTRGENRNWNPN